MDVGLSMVNVGEYLRAFYLDSDRDNIIAYDIVNALSEFKRLTRASVIDIGNLTVDGHCFKVVYSRAANEGMHISVVNKEGKTIVRGSCIIMGFDTVNGRQTLRDLTDEEVDLIMDNMALMVVTPKDGKEYYNAYVLCNAVFSRD